MALRRLASVTFSQHRVFSTTRLVGYESPDNLDDHGTRWVKTAKAQNDQRMTQLESTEINKTIHKLDKAMVLVRRLEKSLAKLRDDEENRYLTEMALRHTRHDPTGESTSVDFSRKMHKTRKPLKPSYAVSYEVQKWTDDDDWLTERSHEFAKNA